MKLLHMSAPTIDSSCKKNPFHGSGSRTKLADTLTQNRWEFSALLEDSLAGLLALAGLVGCCSLSATQQSLRPQDEPKAPTHPRRPPNPERPAAASTGGAGGESGEAEKKGWRRTRASTATWKPGRRWQRRPPPPPTPRLRGAPG